jgi:hypothetical protein
MDMDMDMDMEVEAEIYLSYLHVPPSIHAFVLLSLAPWLICVYYDTKPVVYSTPTTLNRLNFFCLP